MSEEYQSKTKVQIYKFPLLWYVFSNNVFIHSIGYCNQEIYRPGTAISDGSNLCTGVGGNQNKEFRGNAGGGGEYENIAIVGMNIMIYDYETHSVT